MIAQSKIIWTSNREDFKDPVAFIWSIEVGRGRKGFLFFQYIDILSHELPYLPFILLFLSLVYLSVYYFKSAYLPTSPARHDKKEAQKIVKGKRINN